MICQILFRVNKQNHSASLLWNWDFFPFLLKDDSPFYAVYLRGQCQEKMSAVMHLRIVEVQGDLKHAVDSETVFWYSSQHGQRVCATREEKLIAVMAC